MNGLFLAFEFNLQQTADSTESGIAKKVRKQFLTFQEAGIDMRFLNPYASHNILNRKYRKRLPFFFLTDWDDKELYGRSIDFLYVRKPWHMDGDLILHLRKFKKLNPHSKIVMEIPTYPYDQECHEWFNKPLLIKDKLWRRLLKHYVDRIVTYSDDKEIFGIPAIGISNAMDVQDIPVANYKFYDKNNIHVMLCATLCYWHGYDRAIKGLSDYYKRGGTRNYILHIVGDGDERSTYENQIETLCLKDHIIMHGRMFGKYLDEVYSLCDIAFDSMGRHRSGVHYNSSLKGKEYMAKGLPSISGVRTELDSAKDFPFYLRIPADDTPVDYDMVGIFCDSCYNIGVEAVREQIRTYAKEKFSYKETLSSIVKFAYNK